MSNFMRSKKCAVTKICHCVDLPDTLNTWWKRFIMIITILCYFQFFTSCQESMRTFSKHYSKCKTVSKSSEKTLQERRLAILKSSQDNPPNFLTSKNVFITLQYSGDILGIFLKQKFVQCWSNTLETLLRDYWNLPKDQHLLLSSHTVLTQKKLFHGEVFKSSSPLKWSLNFPWMWWTLQRWRNTQQVFSEYCVPAGVWQQLSEFQLPHSCFPRKYGPSGVATYFKWFLNLFEIRNISIYKEKSLETSKLFVNNVWKRNP